MPAAVWWTIAIAALAGMFAACVLLVVVGVRLVESALARRRGKAAE